MERHHCNVNDFSVSGVNWACALQIRYSYLCKVVKLGKLCGSHMFIPGHQPWNINKYKLSLQLTDAVVIDVSWTTEDNERSNFAAGKRFMEIVQAREQIN